MDTIIYLEYANCKFKDERGECSYTLKVCKMQDYQVVKLLVRERIAEIVLPQGGKRSFRAVGNSLLAVGKRLKYRHNKGRQNRLRKAMKDKLQQELAVVLEQGDEIWVSYDETVAVDLWVRQLLPFQEFEGYLEKEWVNRLLPQATNDHFMVLGDAPYIKEVFWKLAPYMKSLLWIAPDRASEEDIEDFAEEFYQETGLAIRLQFLPADITYGQFSIPEYLVKEPVNILDFTESKHIPRIYPPKGSIWLDLASDRDKERRICARGLSCSVISLRKQWKKAPFA